MTEVYLLFYQAVLPVFTNFNLILQQEEPCIHLIDDEMISFIKKLCGKFLSLDELKNTSSLLQANVLNQVSNSKLFIGFLTKQRLRELEDDSLEHTKIVKLFSAVRKFYEATFNYAVKNLPFDDIVLKHAKFVNFTSRYDACIESVEYFVDRYSKILAFKANEFDSLHDEFIAYQLLSDKEIPAKVIEEVTVTSRQKDGTQKTHLRMDTVWGYLSEAKCSSGPSRFPNLSRVAQLVLTLPHSNADEECVFSLIKKNKTEFHASMDLNMTLSSIISLKMNLDDPSPGGGTPILGHIRDVRPEWVSFPGREPADGCKFLANNLRMGHNFGIILPGNGWFSSKLNKTYCRLVNFYCK